MNEKKENYIWLILANVFLLCIGLGLLAGLMPVHWRETSDFAITKMEEDGSLKSATVYSYSPNPKWFQPDKENVKYGPMRMNKLYLQQKLASISEEYVRTYGFDTKILLEKKSVSAKDFCYTISGASNGAVWEVWVVCPRGEEPRVMVYTGEEVAQ